MVSPQLYTWVAIALVVAAVCCAVRLYALRLVSVYPAFIFLLISQVATTVLSELTGLQTAAYAYIYSALVFMEWLAYGLMLRELYEAIFVRFAGIAILGRWSVYAASAATLVAFLFGLMSAQRSIIEGRTLLVAVELASHCLLFGFAALILVILVVISWYPLDLHKNIIVNSLLFGSILLGETAGLIADQLTARHYTPLLNFAETLLGAICLAVWPILLSREGQTKILRLRRVYDVGDEARLLGQLHSVNALLLRAARK